MYFSIIARILQDKSGATAIEYGLLAALIGIGAITAIAATGSPLNGVLETTSSALTTAG